MTSDAAVRHARRGRLAVLFGSMIAVAAPAASAQDEAAESRVTVELNKLEDRDEACRAYMVFGNRTDRPFDEFKLDLVMFAPDGVISRRLAVDAAPLAAGRTVVKLFDVGGLACADIGRILINGGTCPAADDCVALIEPSSLGDVPLIK